MQSKSQSNPPILIFDDSSITSGNIHFWREVSALGTCLVPEAAMAAVKFLAEDVRADRSNAEPESAAAAEFVLFFAKSNWKTTAVLSNHEELAPNPGHDVSRKSRLGLMVAQCAYGIASQDAGVLVVLVTNTQPLIHRIEQLGVTNLCAVTAAAVRQWARTKQPPVNVAKSIATLQVTHSNHARSYDPQPKNQVEDLSQQWSSKKKPRRDLKRIIMGVMGWGVVVIVLLYGWQSLQPKQFKQFWQKTGLPALPILPFESGKPKAK